MNRKTYALTILYLALFVHLVYISGCRENTPAEYQEISVDSLKTIIDSFDNLLIVDVRTPEEFVGSLGHIPGSILRPVQEIEDWYKEFLEYQNKTIYLVCRSGNRSGRATRFLSERGFTRVVNLTGGMLAWNSKKYSVETGKNQEVLEAPVPPK